MLRGRLPAVGVRATSDSYLADTWEWDGATWTRIMGGIVPPQRANHALAYDAARARVLLFGGANARAASDATGSSKPALRTALI